MKPIFQLFLFSFLLSSCITFHQGTFLPTTTPKNIIYEDQAISVFKTQKLFYFGGWSSDALTLEARRKLITNRPLLLNEEYANYTLDIKTFRFLMYTQKRITMTADVIKPMVDSTQSRYSENYKNKVFTKNYFDSLFSIGDSVFYSSDCLESGVIISFESNKSVLIRYKTNKDKIRTILKYTNEIYLNKNSYKGIKINEIYSISSDDILFNHKIYKVIFIGKDYVYFSPIRRNSINKERIKVSFKILKNTELKRIEE